MVNLKQNITSSSLSATAEKLSHSLNQRNNHINRQNGGRGEWGGISLEIVIPPILTIDSIRQISQTDLAIIKLLIKSAKISNGTL